MSRPKKPCGFRSTSGHFRAICDEIGTGSVSPLLEQEGGEISATPALTDRPARAELDGEQAPSIRSPCAARADYDGPWSTASAPFLRPNPPHSPAIVNLAIGRRPPLLRAGGGHKSMASHAGLIVFHSLRSAFLALVPGASAGPASNAGRNIADMPSGWASCRGPAAARYPPNMTR